VTQAHLQVTPANNDGPGVNLILSLSQPEFAIPAPPNWYGLLPGMSYTWRVRVSDSPSAAGSDDPSWSDWSAPAVFRTPAIGPETIGAAEPAMGAGVSTLTPTLAWTESNPNSWYYEVQVSRDPAFGPFGPSAFLYWELRHGGVTNPPRSYQVPAQFPLEPGQQYYWRVRPRVQGDGAPTGWSPNFTFTTPQQASGPVDGQVTAVIDGASIEVILGGQRRIVRYLGIAAPRVAPTECYGAQAAARNSELVEGQIVRLERDQTDADPAGRLLRYVYVGARFINAELLIGGHARVAVLAPDTRYEAQFRGWETEARNAGRGLWSACGQ
jgi:micrococcal nuclease